MKGRKRFSSGLKYNCSLLYCEQHQGGCREYADSSHKKGELTDNKLFNFTTSITNLMDIVMHLFRILFEIMW